jgi:hypothetical protein
MTREQRNTALSVMFAFPDDPSVVPTRSLNDAQLMMDGGFAALDRNLLTTARDLLRRAKELAEEAFACFLRTDITVAAEANEILGRIENGLSDVEEMLKARR